jgi:hypothetical protein
MLGMIVVLLSSACSSLTDPSSGPTPVPVPSPTPLPAAEVMINVLPPEGTSNRADLALVLIDEVTSLVSSNTVIPMKRLADGRWQVRLTPPVGSLLRYYYIRNKPSLTHEVTTSGTPIHYRVAHIPGPIQIDDIIASWADVRYQGEVGRITGRIIHSTTGVALPEMLVTAAGVSDFTDGEGYFRIDGLPPGLHNFVALSTDGSFHTAQQGVVIAAESMTPVEIGLQPAKAVQVTFELVVPTDTIPGTPVRIAGNVRQLGHRFSANFTSQMPELALVDPTHYLTVVTLYAGTDLRYKYTQGDGLWNAERDSRGNLLTRQLIVPDYDLVVTDSISTWHERDAGSLRFHLTVPEDTPPSDQISIQFFLTEWHPPLPMWLLETNNWYYILHGPLEPEQELRYRYCRNAQCGSADDADTFGPNPIGRQVTVRKEPQDLHDDVSAWQWWDPDLPSVSVVAPEINPRPDFETGVTLLPSLRPDWFLINQNAINDLSELGTDSMSLSSTWTLGSNEQTPVLTFDPAYAPFESDLRTMASIASDRGIALVLRPHLRSLEGEVDAWWDSALRNEAWWTVWFEEFRSMLVTTARQAQGAGFTKLVLGGSQITPCLPEGILPDGTSSGVPAYAEDRWRTLLEDVRASFSGKLAFEIEMDQSLQAIPNFLDTFDEIHIYWHAPLTTGESPNVPELRMSARSLLEDQILANPAMQGTSLLLDVEYLSVGVSATACAMAPDGSCRPSNQFDQGALIDPDLSSDMEGQAQAINAVLLEAFARPEIIGFYVHGYNPMVVLHDMSASVNGKPASDVIRYWYPRINGRQ